MIQDAIIRPKKIRPLEPALLHLLEQAVEDDLSVSIKPEYAEDILDAIYSMRDRAEALEARLARYEIDV